MLDTHSKCLTLGDPDNTYYVTSISYFIDSSWTLLTLNLSYERKLCHRMYVSISIWLNSRIRKIIYLMSLDFLISHDDTQNILQKLCIVQKETSTLSLCFGVRLWGANEGSIKGICPYGHMRTWYDMIRVTLHKMSPSYKT